MKTIFIDFEKECRKRFKFLEEELGFDPPKRDVGPTYISLTYQNKTTAVRVSFEPVDRGVFVLLSRLVNGKIPKYPIFITSGTKLDSFYLDDLVKLSLRRSSKKQNDEQGHSKKTMEWNLQQSAIRLQEHGVEILRGDFSVFVDLDSIVKERLSIGEDE